LLEGRAERCSKLVAEGRAAEGELRSSVEDGTGCVNNEPGSLHDRKLALAGCQLRFLDDLGCLPQCALAAGLTLGDHLDEFLLSSLLHVAKGLHRLHPISIGRGDCSRGLIAEGGGFRVERLRSGVELFGGPPVRGYLIEEPRRFGTRRFGVAAESLGLGPHLLRLPLHLRLALVRSGVRSLQYQLDLSRQPVEWCCVGVGRRFGGQL